MSDFEKISETQEMINNQHNIMSERIRSIESLTKSMTITMQTMMEEIDAMRTMLSSINIKLNEYESLEKKRFDISMSQNSVIKERLNTIDRNAKLAAERT